MTVKSGLGAMIQANRPPVIEPDELPKPLTPIATDIDGAPANEVQQPVVTAESVFEVTPVDRVVEEVPRPRSPRTRTQSPSGAGVPKRVGNAPVVQDRQGRYYVPKSLNFPLDIATAIQQRVGVHRRSDDGEITYAFQDIAVDLIREALQKKKP